MSARPDPVRQLQATARQIAGRFVPGSVPNVVEIKDAGGRLIFSVAVPAGSEGDAADDGPGEAAAPAGWDVDGRRALYDGRTVTVSPSRLKLLQVLVRAERPLAAKELARLAFDREADEENARYHVKALRAELSKAFPDFEGEIIPGEGGYRLALW